MKNFFSKSLERLSKTVYEKLSTTSSFTQLLFKLAYESKLQSFRAGRSTRLLDRILFKRISRAVVGKKLRLLVCGGAMLSKEVQEFVQVVLCPVMQAYGLTETCGGGTSQLPNQTDTGIVLYNRLIFIFNVESELWLRINVLKKFSWLKC